MFRTVGLIVIIALPVVPALAAQPAALVESVSAPVAGVVAMNYLTAGSGVDLGKDTVLVLDYLVSCVRETITGGTVQIGATQSEVKDGHVSRRRLDCDGGDLALAASQSTQGAVAVYRRAGDQSEQPQLVLHSTAPLIIAGLPGSLRIERLDVSEPAIEVPVRLEGGATHVMIDLARAHGALQAGGLYQATLGSRRLVFKVAQSAPDARAPLLSRMLPL